MIADTKLKWPYLHLLRINGLYTYFSSFFQWNICPNWKNIEKSNAITYSVAWSNNWKIKRTYYAFFLHNRDAIEITLWLDNCSAQNENWALFGKFFRGVFKNTEHKIFWSQAYIYVGWRISPPSGSVPKENGQDLQF